MVFSAPIFLFLFLPLVLLLAFVTRRRLVWQNRVLLAGSLVFYAWGEGLYLAVILGSIVVNYAVGRMMEGRRTDLWLAIGITVNIALLATFKYIGFFAQLVRDATSSMWWPVPQVHLPIGISFFTFQAISYLVDVRRGKAPVQRRLVDLALYICLFPQLLAGPIIRYGDISSQLVQRSVRWSDFACGVRRFVLGLAKKVLIADAIGQTVQFAFSRDVDVLSSPVAWLGCIGFSLQIYYDFSGYSDMAIGLGRMFGFRFSENFDRPYASYSMTEFWRRWHISLSTWFRDYLYIPLGGSRRGSLRTRVNLWIVFLLCGLWHGAATNFLVWGAYHGLFLSLEKGLWGRMQMKLPRAVRWCMTFGLVCVGWVLFRADSLVHAVGYIERMVTEPDGSVFAILNQHLDSFQKAVFTAGFVGLLPWHHASRLIRDRAQGWGVLRDVSFALALLMSLLTVASTTFRPFLYFRF